MGTYCVLTCLCEIFAMLKLTKEQIQKTSGPWWQPRVRRTLVEITSHTAQQR